MSLSSPFATAPGRMLKTNTVSRAEARREDGLMFYFDYKPRHSAAKMF